MEEKKGKQKGTEGESRLWCSPNESFNQPLGSSEARVALPGCSEFGWKRLSLYAPMLINHCMWALLERRCASQGNSQQHSQMLGIWASHHIIFWVEVVSIIQNGKACCQKWKSISNCGNSITAKFKWSQRKNVGILVSYIEKAPKWKGIVVTAIISCRDLVSNHSTDATLEYLGNRNYKKINHSRGNIINCIC